MGLDNLLATLGKRGSVTSVTSVTLGDVTPKPAWIKTCTSVTPVTSQNNVTADDATMTNGKPETLLDKRREKVLQMLADNPTIRRAF